ncbi:MAG: Na-K-Cl cotransporter, partial [Ardenticatenaceae bacterium]|nr:Na-K-Cl cotransporter [Ardenticatenaceae bacterium]
LARVAPVDDLLSNTTVMVDKAFWSWAILAGLLGATFSSALGSLLAAPRVLQALSSHDVLPMGQVLARETADHEPRNAMLLTGGIVFVTLLFAWAGGGLNAIAPLITMFFLITYFSLNAVMLIEQTLGMVSFRPTFAIPRIVPFIGMMGCLFVMFLVNPIFSLVAILVTLGIYGYLLRRHLNSPWEDVRSGLFLALANWAVERVSAMPPSPERTWSPNLLVPVASGKQLTGIFRFLRAIAAPQGSVRALGIYAPGQAPRVAALPELVESFNQDGIGGRAIMLEEADFATGVRATMAVLSSSYFRPNILFLPALPGAAQMANRESWVAMLERAVERRLAVVLYAQDDVTALGQEQVINVWVREQGPDWKLALRLTNLDLAVLLAYQVARNWHGRINLCMVVDNDETQALAEPFLHELISLARLPASTRIHIYQGRFWESLPKAPRADLTILGLQTHPDLDFVARAVSVVDGTCVFVRDSGDESALA